MDLVELRLLTLQRAVAVESISDELEDLLTLGLSLSGAVLGCSRLGAAWFFVSKILNFHGLSISTGQTSGEAHALWIVLWDDRVTGEVQGRLAGRLHLLFGAFGVGRSLSDDIGRFHPDAFGLEQFVESGGLVDV